MTAAAPPFDTALVAALDEPVRRYFAHAIASGTAPPSAVRLRLRGRIKVGAWLRFDSTWEGDARSFRWRAAAGPGRAALLAVHDRFGDGHGSMDVRLRPPHARLPALRLLHASGDDVARSGAGRAALEGLWVPGALLPRHGVAWRAVAEDAITATWDVPPERPELRIAIGPDGAVRSYHAERWRSAKAGYVPFGADVHAERTFDGVTVPSRLTAGWGHGTPAWSPFFEAEAIAAERAI